MIDSMLEQICGSNLFSDIYKTISINLFSDDSSYSGALTIIRDINSSVIQPIALMLMLIFFFIALVDKMSSENFTWEQMARQMAMFFASFYLILHGFEILELLFEMGLSLAAEVYNLVKDHLGNDGSSFLKPETIQAFKDSVHIPYTPKFIDTVILFVYLLIPWVLSWILTICVNIICYTRVIEIYARATFAPVALSDFFQNGFQGAGWRFLKSFLAVCLQGALLLVIATIFSTLFEAVLMNGNANRSLFASIGTYLAFLAASVMLMFKSQSICKELLGVN